MIEPTAFEVLAFGTGLLREHYTSVRYYDHMSEEDDEPEMREVRPKVTSEKAKTTMSAIMFNELRSERKFYESTNEMLADTYGELEQIAARRDDKQFLSQYLEKMRETIHQMFEVMPEERAFRLPGYSQVWFKHVSLGIWYQPPETIDELLERADFLLKNTFIDEHAVEKTIILPGNSKRVKNKRFNRAL